MKEKQSQRYETRFSQPAGRKDEKTKEIPGLEEKHVACKNEKNPKKTTDFSSKKKRDRPLRAGKGLLEGNVTFTKGSAKIQNRRVFFTAFVVTLCILSFVIGILQADYYCRQTGFGDDNTLIHRITGKNGDLLDFFLSL